MGQRQPGRPDPEPAGRSTRSHGWACRSSRRSLSARATRQWEASPRGLTPARDGDERGAARVRRPHHQRADLVQRRSRARRSQPTCREPTASSASVGLALRFAALRRKPNAAKRAGADADQLQRQGVAHRQRRRAGYAGVGAAPAARAAMPRATTLATAALPADGDTLLAQLIDRCSYDTELLTEQQLRNAAARVPVGTTPLVRRAARDAISSRWQRAGARRPARATSTTATSRLAGLRFGNVFVALQPPRGYGMDPNLIYHQPDLPPTAPLPRALPLAARRLAAPTRSSTSASTARWNGCPARRRPVGDVLPRPAAGRSAADLPVHHQRPRRGRAGQAAHPRGHRRPPDAADDHRRRLRQAGRAGAAGGRVLPGRGARPDQAADAPAADLGADRRRAARRRHHADDPAPEPAGRPHPRVGPGT